MAFETRSAPGARRWLDDAIGDTPMVRLSRVVPGGGAEVRVKLEAANPGGSVKARPARAIVREAEREGLLEGRTLLDASSGNTGIAYAMLCAARGVPCEICMPDSASEERKRALGAYGARVILTDPDAGPEGAIREARRRAEAHQDRYFYADQYGNPANPRAHYETTGREILEQTGGRVTHFVAALGTTGTFTGTARRLREDGAGVRMVAVQPASPLHGIEGVKHLATAAVPEIWDPAVPDETVAVRTERAQAVARRLGREEGLFAGPSGGANVDAALRIARTLDPDALVVTLLPDGGERYMSEPWMSDDGDGCGER